MTLMSHISFSSWGETCPESGPPSVFTGHLGGVSEKTAQKSRNSVLTDALRFLAVAAADLRAREEFNYPWLSVTPPAPVRNGPHSTCTVLAAARAGSDQRSCQWTGVGGGNRGIN